MQSPIITTGPFTTLPGEILEIIIKRTILNDPAIIATIEGISVSGTTPFLRTTRPQAANALTLVNKLFHEIFETVVSRFVWYKLKVDIRAVEVSTAVWTNLINADEVRYMQLVVITNPIHLILHREEILKRGLPAITQAVRQFSSLRDTEIIFNIPWGGSDSTGTFDRSSLLFKFGRSIWPMPKLIGYRLISFVRHVSLEECDEVREYIVRRTTGGKWRPASYSLFSGTRAAKLVAQLNIGA